MRMSIELLQLAELIEEAGHQVIARRHLNDNAADAINEFATIIARLILEIEQNKKDIIKAINN